MTLRTGPPRAGLIRMPAGGHTLVEVAVVALVLLALWASIGHVVSGTQRGFARGQETIAHATELALMASHLRADVASLDGPAGDARAAATVPAEGALDLAVRSGAVLTTVRYRMDRAHGLLLRTGPSREEVIGRHVTDFRATPRWDEADGPAGERAPTDATGTTTTVAAAPGGRRFRVHVEIAVRVAREASPSRAPERRMVMVISPVSLNRKLASSWPADPPPPPAPGG